MGCKNEEKNFIGKKALKAELSRGPEWNLVGLKLNGKNWKISIVMLVWRLAFLVPHGELVPPYSMVMNRWVMPAVDVGLPS
ncbi:MAG: hypothetical protein Ct9H300mP29_2780 [Candidatus Neomarinimicrobiota bacterium]|nr:MAG: hypothetical protein Ct9H300mP29_2780 [Candidatus Neomarinimicrobiota bacterium]